MRSGIAVQGIIVFFWVWTVVILPAPGFGSAPQQINYQGALTNSLGSPLNGDHVMVFSIYNVSSGGIPLWWEQQTVKVTNGICNVQIGRDPGNNPFPSDLFDGPRWLGVTVGADDEMLPRQPLTSVPFALKADMAQDAEMLQGHGSDYFAAQDHGHDFVDITGMVSDAQVPNDITILNAEHADHAINAETAANAELLGGLDAASFALVEHGHIFGQISGQADDAQIPNDITINYAAQAGNADTLDGVHAAAFMPGGTDNWVNEDGDTMSGRLEVTTNIIGTSWGESIKGVLNTLASGAGVYGWSGGTSSYGVAGGATGSSGRGVYGEVTGDNAIGVYGDALNTTAGTGVFGRGAAWAGYFDGNLYAGGNVGIGTADPVSRLDVNGTTTTKVLAITGGADIAEPFDVKPDMAVKPGMVLSIDAKNPGKLKLSEKAYDRCVAGIISSAGGIQPGMIMSQTGTVAEGEHPIALSGRVYCWADAGRNPIVPGDLLTTSDIPGHAMKATDMGRSQGAVLGKAMTALKEGKGLVLVLVSLQ